MSSWPGCPARAAERRQRALPVGALGRGGPGGSRAQAASARSAPTRHACWTTSSSVSPNSRAARRSDDRAGRPVHARHPARAARTRRAGHGRLPASGAHRQYLPGRRRPPAAPHGCRARQIEAGAAAAAARRSAAAPPQRAAGAERCGRPQPPPRPPPRATARRPRGRSRQTASRSVSGRYQLEREIGRGAMGIVYLGRDTAINRAGRDQGHPARQRIQRIRTRRSENAVLSRGGNCGTPQSSRTSSPSMMSAKSADSPISRWNI